MHNEISRIISELDTLKARGRKIIQIDLVRNVLNNIVSDSPKKDADLEKLHYQFTHEGKMEEWKESQEINRLLLNSVMTFAGGALRVITWMNGGAAVACLAYAGNLKDKSLLTAMLYFTYGLLAGGLAHGGAYMSQFNYCHDKKKTGDVFRNICIILVLLAYIFFLSGALSGYYGIKNGG